MHWAPDSAPDTDPPVTARGQLDHAQRSDLDSLHDDTIRGAPASPPDTVLAWRLVEAVKAGIRAVPDHEAKLALWDAFSTWLDTRAPYVRPVGWQPWHALPDLWTSRTAALDSDRVAQDLPALTAPLYSAGRLTRDEARLFVAHTARKLTALEREALGAPCAYCGEPTPLGRSGKPMKYCSEAHKTAYHRARKAGTPALQDSETP